MLTLLATGCAKGVSDSAICDGTKASRSEHAAALADEGSDAVVLTGANLISQIDAACGMM